MYFVDNYFLKSPLVITNKESLETTTQTSLLYTDFRLLEQAYDVDISMSQLQQSIRHISFLCSIRMNAS